MTNELKPCPFCGVVPTEIERDSGRYRTIVYHTPHCPALDPGYRTKTAALAAWNTRPVEDALRASVAELQAQLVDVSAALQRANEATSRAERERDVLKIERDALYRQLGLSVRGDTHD